MVIHGRIERVCLGWQHAEERQTCTVDTVHGELVVDSPVRERLRRGRRVVIRRDATARWTGWRAEAAY